LGYAQLLERSTEVMLAHIALAEAGRVANDADGYAQHVAALDDIDEATVARWARTRAASLVAAKG
jgi:hypothetical protein